MMPFRILFLLTFFTFILSCAEKVEIKAPAKVVERRRLFEIKDTKCIIPDSSVKIYRRSIHPILEVTLKNVSNFDLNVHCYNDYPVFVYAYDTYIFYPNSGTPTFDFADSSRIIKKNEEFIALLSDLSLEEFYAYEFQGVKLQILISSSNDLSFYFEDNPNKPWFRNTEGNDHKKKYAYPFQFTYWVTNDVFWEDHLLEHKPRFYWEESTDDK
jgi:hypothetical protein